MSYNNNANNNANSAYSEEAEAIDNIHESLSDITRTLQENGYSATEIMDVLNRIGDFVLQDAYVETENDRNQNTDIAVSDFPESIQGELEELYGNWYHLHGQQKVKDEVDIFISKLQKGGRRNKRKSRKQKTRKQTRKTKKSKSKKTKRSRKH
jgi:hypothetical protein